MGKAKTPAAPKAPPPPVEAIAGQPAAEAERKFLKNRKGASSAWITKGQNLGSGAKLQ